MTTKDDGEALFGPEAIKNAGGPVYQGVTAELRRLTASGKKWKGKVDQIADPDLDAGSIAQARAIAASIDRLEAAKASGMQLAALHEQLGKVLERLNPSASTDPFQEFLAELDKEDTPDGPATATHPEV